MHTIRCIIRKEFLQIFRDPAMLRIMFALPIIQLFVLGYAITFDVKNVALVVRDEDHTQLSRLLVEKIQACGRFRLKAHEPRQQALDRYLDRREALLAFSIPRGFAREVAERRRPSLQVLVDGVDSNTSLVALGYLQQIMLSVGADLVSPSADLVSPPAADLPAPVARYSPRIRVWFNPEMESVYFMVPGIIAVLLTVTTTLLTSMAIVREREIGTLEQLNVTPIRPYQLIAGKIIPFALLSFVMLALALAVALLWYRIPLAGSVLLLFLFSSVFLLTTLGAGLFISTLCTTQQQALFITWAFSVFGILMSGLFAPIESMPPFVQQLTHLNPLRYFMSIIREIFLKGSGIGYLWKDGLSLVVWGGAMMGLSILRFNKRAG